MLLQFNSLNLHQIITHPTRYDPIPPNKASLVDVTFTNSPHLYHSAEFCNDISHHSFIAYVRKVHLIFVRLLTSMSPLRNYG